MTEHQYKSFQEHSRHIINLMRAWDIAQDYWGQLAEKCDHTLPDGKSGIAAGGVSDLYSVCTICGKSNMEGKLYEVRGSLESRTN
jgi:hypothetical protein